MNIKIFQLEIFKNKIFLTIFKSFINGWMKKEIKKSMSSFIVQLVPQEVLLLSFLML